MLDFSYTPSALRYRGLAQLASALALGARGHRFESCNPDHCLKRNVHRQVGFCFYAAVAAQDEKPERFDAT